MKIEIKFMIALAALIAALVAPAHGLEFYSFGEFSYDYEKSIHGIPQGQKWFETDVAIGMEQRVQSATFYAEAEQVTSITQNDLTSYKPHTQDYYARGGVWVGPINLEFEHVCFHAVDHIDYNYRGGYSRVTLGFDSRREWP